MATPVLPVSDAAKPSEADTGRQTHPWYIVIMTAVVVMLGQIDRNVISLVVQPMKRDLGLSDTEVSLLIGFAFSLTYTLVGPPVARIADRGLRKRVIAISLAAWSLATALTGLAQNFWQLFVGRAATGGAEAGSSPASMSLIADVVPREKLPRAYAVYTAGFSAGGALALTLGGLLLGAFAGVHHIDLPVVGQVRDWQMVFIILGLPGLLVAAIIAVTVKEPRRRASHKAEGYPLREVFGYVWQHRAMHIPLLLAVLLNALQAFGTMGWMPAFYERTYGWGPSVVGPIIGPLNLVAQILGLFIGAQVTEWLAKRHDDANLRSMLWGNLLSIPVLVAGPLMPNPWLAIACSTLGMALAASGGGGYNSSLQVSTPNAMRGQINALYLFVVAAIGGGLGPLFIALITDFVTGNEGDLRYALVIFRAVLAPIDCLMIWLAMRPYARALRERIAAGD